MPERIVLATRKFMSQGQESFALLSGDWNPLHMDTVAARRTAAGAPVVHGVHLILWMANVLEQSLNPGNSITAIKAKFTKWVYVGDTADLILLRRDESNVRLQVEVKGLPVTSAAFTLGQRSAQGVTSISDTVAELDARPIAADRDLTELAHMAGFLPFAGPQQALGQMFPRAAVVLGLLEMAGLACTTRLVGMECPGLNSIFAGLDVHFSDDADRKPGLDFGVTSVDERFRFIKIKISGAGLRGTIDAFARVPPVAQATMTDVMKAVEVGEFANSHALIVGGSRGLGEFCAKAIAGGGGKVTITYATGKTEAERVAQEINDCGGECEVLHYDVRNPAAAQLRDVSTPPDHLYFFATGTIFKPRAKGLDYEILDSFLDFYVKGFYSLCLALGGFLDRRLVAFYPSSVFVEERPDGMLEYAMAKSAGEVLCSELPRLVPGLRVVTRRLPRLPTDQTASVLPVKGASVAEVMLPILREVYACGRVATY